MKNTKKKTERWEYLNELDGRPTDPTPVRSLYRRPAPWEWVLYGLTALLWLAALSLAILGRYGAAGLTTLGICVCCLRPAVYELRRKKRCKGALLGTVASFTRRPHIRKNARYPVIRFEVNGVTYCAYGPKACHPSTQGNEEWVKYNPQDPADCYVAASSKLKAAVLLTVMTGILGVILLILEAS